VIRDDDVWRRPVDCVIGKVLSARTRGVGSLRTVPWFIPFDAVISASAKFSMNDALNRTLDTDRAATTHVRGTSRNIVARLSTPRAALMFFSMRAREREARDRSRATQLVTMIDAATWSRFLFRHANRSRARSRDRASGGIASRDPARRGRVARRRVR
jgi:hypothetical protein